jgi:RNA-directed DNA polymerase
MDLLARKIQDQWMLRLIRLWLAVGTLPSPGKAVPQRAWERSGGRGVVQGGALSPLLSNVYLHPFDRAMLRQGYPLVRYCDNFLIPCPSKARAQQAREAARRMLAELHLSLHPEKTRIVCLADGFRFLGHSIPAERSRLHSPHSSPERNGGGPSRRGSGPGIWRKGVRKLKKKGRELLERLSHRKRRR